MLKFMFIALFFFVSLPVMAESEPLSPTDIEQLPFDHSLANTPNTGALMNDVDMGTDIEHAEKKAGLPQFDVTTFASQLFWLFIMSVILYVFFAKKALPTISKIMDDRKNTIQSDLEMADRLSIDIDKTRISYEEAMQEAQNNSRAEIVNAEAEIRAESDKQSNDFKEHSAAEVLKLEARALKAKNAVIDDLEQSIHDLTGQIIKQLTDMDIKADDIQKIVNQHLSKPSQLSQKKAA
jgi:F-type H+-transporting ATPase subunit b